MSCKRPFLSVPLTLTEYFSEAWDSILVTEISMASEVESRVSVLSSSWLTLSSLARLSALRLGTPPNSPTPTLIWLPLAPCSRLCRSRVTLTNVIVSLSTTCFGLLLGSSAYASFPAASRSLGTSSLSSSISVLIRSRLCFSATEWLTCPLAPPSPFLFVLFDFLGRNWFGMLWGPFTERPPLDPDFEEALAEVTAPLVLAAEEEGFGGGPREPAAAYAGGADAGPEDGIGCDAVATGGEWFPYHMSCPWGWCCCPGGALTPTLYVVWCECV
mmetsp:Transcript_6528/g.23457  ORF Transcript_6528/g.23457 Transcript_6528/m.23457 type:complete len:272 (+) Transcript_6528:317-1132(+)